MPDFSGRCGGKRKERRSFTSLNRIGRGTEKTGGAGDGAENGREIRSLTVTMRTLVPRIRTSEMMLSGNESGVEVKETARDPARGILSRACGSDSSLPHWNVCAICYADRDAWSTVRRCAKGARMRGWDVTRPCFSLTVGGHLCLSVNRWLEQRRGGV